MPLIVKTVNNIYVNSMKICYYLLILNISIKYFVYVIINVEVIL